MTFTLTKKSKERVEAALREPSPCRCPFPRLECPACHRDCDACREGYDEYRRNADARGAQGTAPAKGTER